MVKPTHLKNMLVKLDHFPKDPGWKLQKIVEFTTQLGIHGTAISTYIWLIFLMVFMSVNRPFVPWIPKGIQLVTPVSRDAITKPWIDENDQDWGCKPKATHHLEVAYVVFPSLPVKYLLRLGVLAMFFGVQIPPHQVFGSLGFVEVKKNVPKVTSKICRLC